MAPLRGWAPRGHRLPTKVPHGRWKTMTFLAALRHDRIDAPWFIEGPIDGESFRTYVEKVLLPTLRPGDIVVMDNLGSHRSKAVRQLIRSAGAKLFFLPKYSPDLNPIEQVFAKLKHLLRKAAARTVDAVCAAIGEVLRCLHTRRMRQLPQKFRLSNLMSSRFSGHAPLHPHMRRHRGIRKAGLPVGVADLADVDVAARIERDAVRRDEFAGLEAGPVLAAQPRDALPLSSTMLTRGPIFGHSRLTGMPGPSSPMMKFGFLPPPQQHSPQGRCRLFHCASYLPLPSNTCTRWFSRSAT